MYWIYTVYVTCKVFHVFHTSHAKSHPQCSPFSLQPNPRSCSLIIALVQYIILTLFDDLYCCVSHSSSNRWLESLWNAISRLDTTKFVYNPLTIVRTLNEEGKAFLPWLLGKFRCMQPVKWCYLSYIKKSFRYPWSVNIHELCNSDSKSATYITLNQYQPLT